MRFDPIQVEVWRHLFASVAEEMGATLERTGFSPNIKERRDYSCALFDAQGRLIAQAAHIPVHLGAMPLMMERLRDSVAWRPGTMWLCNDPATGGTHLPDLTLAAPVYAGDSAIPGPLKPRAARSRQLVGFVANRAHHADIGGIAPGSLPLSSDIHQEGLVIPPVRLVTGGRVQQDIVALICANSRTPAERRGDLAAQVAANHTGARRLQDLIGRFGLGEVERRAKESRLYAEEVVRRTLARAPDGDYEQTDWMDDDGIGETDLPIHVTVRIRAGRITCDFSGSAPEVAGPINATEAVTRSACYYIVRCLVADEIPVNAGVSAAVDVIAPPGSLVNASPGRAVAAGNVETSQRIVDVLLGALAPAFPDRIPASSQGTMNNLTIGGRGPAPVPAPASGQAAEEARWRTGDRARDAFAYYETTAGGAGGSPDSAGASAVHVHMTNTRNTPIEALEMHYPLRVNRYAIRGGSGGAGEHPGGDGVIREIELLGPAHVTIVSERRRHAPPGMAGGESGAPGRNLIRAPGDQGAEVAGKVSRDCPTGTIVTIETPGGGGWGR